MQSLFGFLAVLHNDLDKSEDTLKSMVGIIGYAGILTRLIPVMSQKHSLTVNYETFSAKVGFPNA